MIAVGHVDDRIRSFDVYRDHVHYRGGPHWWRTLTILDVDLDDVNVSLARRLRRWLLLVRTIFIGRPLRLAHTRIIVRL